MKFFLVLALISSTSALANSKKYKLKLNLGSGFDFVDGEKIKARVFGQSINADFKLKLNDYTKLFMDATAVMETGSNEVVGIQDEFAPKENIYINNGGFSITPFSFFNVELGALDQGTYNSPLLLASTAFTAISEKVFYGPVYLKAQQGIPSNNRLSTRLGQVDKGTPYVGIETLGLKYGKKTNINLEVSHYSFKDLSNNIAYYSKTFGNSVSGSSSNNSEYLYDFNGVNAYIAGALDFDTFGFKFSGEYIYNDKAPSGRNTGRLARLGVYFQNIEFYGESFRNESDTAPAYYNSKYYGHNNIIGSGAGFIVTAEDMLFKVRGASFEPIEETGLQTKTDIVSMDFIYNLKD